MHADFCRRILQHQHIIRICAECRYDSLERNLAIPAHAQALSFACAGGAELYEAAVLLKSVLRGRGILLIEDRTDIVGAAEADGVVLSRQGRIHLPCHKDTMRMGQAS